MASPPEEETRSQWQLAADAILKQAPVAEVSPPDRSCNLLGRVFSTLFGVAPLRRGFSLGGEPHP